MSATASLLGISDYGSDSEDDDQEETQAPQPSTSATKPASGLQLPPPKSKKRDGPVVITVEKPKRPAAETTDEPASKRPRAIPDGSDTSTRSGRSSLLSLLPPPSKSKLTMPPKKKAPAPTSTSSATEAALTRAAATNSEHDVYNRGAIQHPVPASNVVNPWELEYEPDADQPAEEAARPLNPSTLFKQQWERQSVEGGLDLGEAYLARRAFDPLAAAGGADKPEPPTFMPEVIAAPTLEEWENFVPPEPKPDDPYPGFYKHPSGSWEQYDRDYYMQFYEKWIDPQNASEPGPPPKERGFEQYREAYGIDARKRWEEAQEERKRREAQKPTTVNSEEQPRMTLTAAKTSKVARSRHQLSTLLSDAYSNREALEERIAQGKRNRKEAGHKYGF